MKLTIISFCLLLLAPTWATAQKKVVEVSQTKLLNISLPPGSKQDNRLLSTVSAEMLLELVSTKAGTGMKNTEVYYVPASAAGFTADLLVESLAGKGYELAGVEEDEQYAWVYRGKECYLIYLSFDKQETNLYIGECLQHTAIATSPAQAAQTESYQPQEANPPVYYEQPTSPTPPVQPPAATQAGWHFTTTNFDDGWTAIQETDWVRVSKGNITVLLHYGLNFDDDMRMNPTEVCWNILHVGRYHVRQLYTYHYSALNFSYYYLEADVTDRNTGRNMFVGFLVVPVSGVAYAIEIQSPDKATYQRNFPDVEGIGRMSGYNKFALHASDLTGTWSSFGSSHISLYNVYTGGHAGLNYASINDEFNFFGDDSYSSKHVGASSSYGSTSYFNDNFNGKHITREWDIALTNRRDGRTDEFHAQFEAVKGGRLLLLTHKKYSGINYRLVKSK